MVLLSALGCITLPFLREISSHLSVQASRGCPYVGVCENKGPQVVGSSYNQDPKKVPLISEAPHGECVQELPNSAARPNYRCGIRHPTKPHDTLKPVPLRPESVWHSYYVRCLRQNFLSHGQARGAGDYESLLFGVPFLSVD